MLSHVKKERKAQIEKNNKRSLSEFETVSVSARRGLFFCKIFVPYLTTAYGQPEKSLISCGFTRRDLFLPQLVSVCHGALRSGVISGINGFWLRSILNPPQRKLISRNSIRSASWYALCAELCLMSLLILEAIPKLIRCKGTDGILG